MQQRTIQILSIAFFVCLVAWGLYTLLAYLGVGVHVAVLVPDSAKTTVDSSCPSGGLLCRGWFALFPFIGHTIARASPFLWYALLSAILYGVYVTVQFLRTGEWVLTVRAAPWKIVVLFVVCTWLLFTTLSYSKNEDMPMTRLFEPVPQVYVDADEEAMAGLQRNYQALLKRGCLREIGKTPHGARVYDYTGRCIQQAFFTRVLSEMGFIALLLMEFLVLGSQLHSLLQRLLRRKHHAEAPAGPREEQEGLLLPALVSLGLGACALIALLWAIAAFSSESAPLYTKAVVWSLLIVIPAACYRHVILWAKRLVRHRTSFQLPVFSVSALLLWLLVSYLALNFLTVIRPFPIGWDDLGSYLNRPRLLVSYGHAIPTMARFEWEYLTSLGFLLFGYDSTFGATTSMLINWTAGLFGVLLTYLFARLYFSRSAGFLAALLYYTLPLIGHFSYADMKIDNAAYFLGGLGLLCIFLFLFPPENQAPTPHPPSPGGGGGSRVWLLLAGIFLGFAFAVKYTTIMIAMAASAVLIGGLLHWTAFFGAVFLALGLFVQQGKLNMEIFLERIASTDVAFTSAQTAGTLLFGGVGLLLVTGACALALRHHRHAGLETDVQRILRRVGSSFGLFAAGFLLAILPWLLRLNVQFDNTVPQLVFTGPDSLSPSILISNNATAPDYGQDIRRLPPELALDPENSLCKSTSHAEEMDRYWGNRQGIGHYLTLPWRTVLNLDSAGYYVTTIPALLLVPLVVLLPAFWSKQRRAFRWLFAATVFLVLQWVLLANGVPWYGIGMFLGTALVLAGLVDRAPDLPSRVVGTVFVTLSLFVSFGMRLWQFESQRNLFEYPMGKVSAEVMEERTIAHYDEIRDIVTERNHTMPAQPYVYRIGTFIPYFIPKNLEVIGHADQQLDTFNCLFQERDAQLTLRRLQSLGFSSIIFDTNTATIERDSQGTLHKKVQAFLDFVNTPGLGLQVVLSDLKAGIAFILIPERLP